MKKAILAWSGGKDSAYALYKIRQENKYEVVGLMTTVNKEFGRVSMHGVREELLDLQAETIGLPLTKMYVSEGTYEEYERKMEAVLLDFKSQGVEQVIFGDIFLEDLRKYREDNLAKVEMIAVFPLWGIDTALQADEFLNSGFKTKICCVNDGYLDESFVGVDFDSKFLSQLPSQVDPCGENGEFHTFCYAGPIFKNELNIKVEEIIYKPLQLNPEDDCNMPKEVQTKGFWFADIMI